MTDLEKPDWDAESYVPRRGETFMNPRQKEYFRRKLLAWRESILDTSRETVFHLKEDSKHIADPTDRASAEADRAVELRARDRERKLIAKIDAALRRIETGEYGYCEVTGEPIGFARLDARPVATLSIEAQKMHEQREKRYRDG